ncbi:MAG: type II toxin-antitoxin system PemK/MazF family toxin [Deltaproteobacteria bacterium]|nr:type II toxin-antitoxin system PemK/MazF family toxin [Deltaproteobacteria bacterium]
MRRGGCYLAALDPVVGHEISKTRPVVVVSNNKNNAFSGTVTVLPITSKNLRKIYPFEVFLAKSEANLPKNSKVKADQIRTLDKSRLVKFIGELDENQIEQIDNATRIHLALR